jgi:hypothetical protein
MYIIEARNVNGAYAELVRTIRREGVLGGSRAGEVLALPAPVMLVTHRPQERVLLDERRDANPFFHLFESLFLLAGRDDYTWLDRFVRNFSFSFGEADGHGHGSYGFRWRRHFGFDQLNIVVGKLKKDPNDRRVVISMWDPTVFAHNGADDLRVEARDIPCNTHIYPRIVGGCLDLTVCCRSNDAIWGATGANAVQFSMLLEYLAGRIGVGVGKLYQLANNCHAYTSRMSKYGEPQGRPYWPDAYDDPEPLATVPIGTDWEAWDDDLRWFMEKADSGEREPGRACKNHWFNDVASAMWLTHEAFRQGDKPGALVFAGLIDAPDWRLACENWIKRRMK